MLFIAIGVTLIVAFLSLFHIQSFNHLQPNISNIDKIEHILAYFVLTFVWLLALKKKTSKYKLVTVLSVFLYGVLLEVLQMKLTSYRQGDVLDGLANSSGILLATFFFDKIYMKMSLIYRNRFA